MSNEQDARTFIDNGEQALNQGHRTEAERDFRAADRALSPNETATWPDSSNSSNSSSTSSANQ